MFRRVVFLVVVFMGAALDLGARQPASGDPEPAPEPGKAEYHGLKLEASVEGKPGQAAVLCFRAHNPTDEAMEADMEVALMESPPSSPMARMVPMPRERARRAVHVALGPGERMEKRFTIDDVKLPKKKKKARRGDNKSPVLAALAMQASPTLFAEVRKEGQRVAARAGQGLLGALARR